MSAGAVLVFSVGGPAFVDPAALPLPQPTDLAALAKRLAAAEVKSCIAHLAKANGMEPAALLAQATPTSGM